MCSKKKKKKKKDTADAQRRQSLENPTAPGVAVAKQDEYVNARLADAPPTRPKYTNQGLYSDMWSNIRGDKVTNSNPRVVVRLVVPKGSS